MFETLKAQRTVSRYKTLILAERESNQILELQQGDQLCRLASDSRTSGGYAHARYTFFFNGPLSSALGRS